MEANNCSFDTQLQTPKQTQDVPLGLADKTSSPSPISPQREQTLLWAHT